MGKDKNNTEYFRGLYTMRESAFGEELRLAQKRSRTFSSLRLTAFIFAIGAFTYGFYNPYSGIPLAIVLLGVFILLIFRHERIKRCIFFLDRLVQINHNAGLRLDGKWTTFLDEGQEYIDHNHPYSTDLNIFGKGSLFQHINTTGSFIGRQILVEQLSSSAKFPEIELRQAAVADLAPRLDFRQQLQAEGMDPFFRKQDPKKVLIWLEQNNQAFHSWMEAVLILPIVTITLFLLAVSGYISYSLPLGALAVQAVAAMLGEKEVKRRFFETEQAVLRLKRYVELINRIMQQEFTAPFLKKQKGLLIAGGIPASRQVRGLITIAEHSNLRYSNALIYFPLNIIFLWDLRTLRRLNRWQKRWGGYVRGWFEATGEIEALSSLAGLCHDNPHWAFPEVQEGAPTFLAEALGHPLIPPAERVANDLSLSHRGMVFIITGSNMSGKSTLLRTVGINLVLAYAGAPICAPGMTCSLMRIYSKMQVHDNLEERVSTFYAELKRMKMIIDAAKSKDPLIFLLDEIFRGTNSRDRIIATRTVIRQLHKLNTIGLISTHDLELGLLEKEYPGRITNYHFTDDICDGRIHFDFRLKPGISQTANAIALMRMIGIQVEEGDGPDTETMVQLTYGESGE